MLPRFTVDGPPGTLVLLLGSSLGTTAAMWAPQLPVLAQRFRVVRYEHPGHGGAPNRPGPFAIADLGGDAVELLDHLGIEHACFAGVSLGAMVAMWVAANHSDRVDRLVLACTAPHLPPASAWHERAALGAPRRRGRAARDPARSLVHGGVPGRGTGRRRAGGRHAGRRRRRGLRAVLRGDRGDGPAVPARQHPSPDACDRRHRRPRHTPRDRPGPAASHRRLVARGHPAGRPPGQPRATGRLHLRHGRSSRRPGHRAGRHGAVAPCWATPTSTVRPPRPRRSTPPSSTSSPGTRGARSGRAQASTGPRGSCITLAMLTALGRFDELPLHVEGRASQRPDRGPDRRGPAAGCRLLRGARGQHRLPCGPPRPRRGSDRRGLSPHLREAPQLGPDPQVDGVSGIDQTEVDRLVDHEPVRRLPGRCAREAELDHPAGRRRPSGCNMRRMSHISRAGSSSSGVYWLRAHRWPHTPIASTMG